MDIKKIKSTLNLIEKDIGNTSAEKLVSTQKNLLNIIESLVEKVEEQTKTIQNLKDEVNKLKGEQGTPKFGKNKQDKDVSSEKERRGQKQKNTRKKKSKKKSKIKIDRKIKREVDKSVLPDDAIFKGYQKNVVQDLTIKTDNIVFEKEVFYSPSLKKTYIAEVPPGYEGQFGPGIKSIVLSFSHDSKLSQPALARFFRTFGIYISSGTISKMLIDDKNVGQFHQEKEKIVAAGLQMPYQNIDDTGSKVNGKNCYTHILCNPLYSAYFTTPRKNRLTVLNILCQNDLRFVLNEETYELMRCLGLADKHLDRIISIGAKGEYTKKALNVIINEILPNPKKRKKVKRIITEACAIAGFHNLNTKIKALICDDAPQFKHLLDIALCWVHEGRHYKKLNPILQIHKKEQEVFLEKFWNYYRKLLDYRTNSSEVYAEKLLNEFDRLFSTKTEYSKLDVCIESTLKKKASLLLVLKHPAIPLHNNAAELGARAEKRKSDVSLQTKNKKGTNAKNTFMTIVQTAIKLSVNIYHYIYDRITKKFEMPSLAELITKNNLQGNVVYES